MSIRDEFEHWFLTRGGHSDDLTPDGQGGYAEYETDLYWEGWEASRKLLVIELPDPEEYYNPDEAVSVLKDCQMALIDVGLTVKP